MDLFKFMYTVYLLINNKEILRLQLIVNSLINLLLLIQEKQRTYCNKVIFSNKTYTLLYLNSIKSDFK